jgi:hypothetical protein
MEPWEYCILVARTAAISAILLRSDESLATLVWLGLQLKIEASPRKIHTEKYAAIRYAKRTSQHDAWGGYGPKPVS